MEERGGTENKVPAELVPVVATQIDDYDLGRVLKALDDTLRPLGGMGAFVKPGERIALKPNLLMATDPDRAVGTHPTVLTAVALAVKEAGAHPVVVESPGTGVVHVASMIERLYRKAGYRAAADEHGFEISLDMNWESVSVPQAKLAKRVEVMSPILAVDGVINLPKFKTHSFMIFTGAVKNLFGVVPGLNKAAYHAKLVERMRFADMLLDVAAFVNPRLNVVDGILAMEGDGPGTGGTPRPLGVLLAGADPVSVDVACCRIAGIDSAAVPVLEAARERGLWSGRPEDVDTLGVPLARLQVSDFAMPKTYEGIGVGSFGATEGLVRRMLRGFNRMPQPRAGRCTVCRTCERACPVQAISMDQAARVARVDDSVCIRCYCCHEVCPDAAIDLEFTGFGRVVNKLGLVK